MKNTGFFKNKRAEIKQAKEKWEKNLENMWKCIVEVVGEEKANEISELMKKRCK